MTITIEPIKGKVNGKEYFFEYGRIANTILGREDHGIFTFVLEFDFAGSGQGAGTYNLNDPAIFGKSVQAVLDFFGANWEELKGRQAYVLREERNGLIRGLVDPTRTSSLIFADVVG